MQALSWQKRKPVKSSKKLFESKKMSLKFFRFSLSFKKLNNLNSVEFYKVVYCLNICEAF